MGDFALVMCQEQKEENTYRSKIMRYITSKIKGGIKKQQIKDLTIKTQLYDNVSMHVIKLPYSKQTLESLNKNKINKIETLLQEIVVEDSIGTCILSNDISEFSVWQTGGCFTGRNLYKSLLVNILEEIYSNRGYLVSELDITIVHGNSLEELNTVIGQLSPFVKYLTILTCEEKVANEADRVYEDTGLSVRVTDDSGSAVKNADLIINLSDSKEFISSPIVRSGAVIINFGDIDCTKILNNSTLINGIDVRFPRKIVSQIDKNIFKHLSTQGLAEVIISHNAGDGATNNNYKTHETLSREFRKSGYSIVGFIGRHNIIGTKDIKLK